MKVACVLHKLKQWSHQLCRTAYTETRIVLTLHNKYKTDGRVWLKLLASFTFTLQKFLNKERTHMKIKTWKNVLEQDAIIGIWTPLRSFKCSFFLWVTCLSHVSCTDLVSHTALSCSLKMPWCYQNQVCKECKTLNMLLKLALFFPWAYCSNSSNCSSSYHTLLEQHLYAGGEFNDWCQDECSLLIQFWMTHIQDVFDSINDCQN